MSHSKVLEVGNPLLYHREMGTGSPLVILHGLLGSLNNWQSIANELSRNFKVILVDQRNHGRSFHSPHHTYPIMAGDVLALLDSLSLSVVDLIGHSMGGKTAMSFAAMFRERVRRLVIVDIAPRAYRSGQDHLLDSLNNLNLTGVINRTDAELLLSRTVPDKRLRQFLLTNLRREDDGKLSWKANIRSLRSNRHEVTKGVELPRPIDAPSLFVRGEYSHYIDRSDLPHIRRFFPDSTVKTIPGAGHWVHADKPYLFLEAVRDFLTDGDST